MLKGRRRRALCSAVMLSIITSTALCSNAGAVPVTSNGQVNQNKGGVTSLVPPNEEKIIEMLKKEGKIPEDATYEEAYEAFLKYMGTMTADEDEKLTREEMKLESNSMPNRFRDGKIQFFSNENNKDKVTEINELVIMVEYPDFPHNTIKPEETEMYYKDYSKEHFQEMLYGDNGYKGPNGEDFMSMKQFYDQESGGTMKIDGTVTKWYQVPHEAKYYGADGAGSHNIRAKDLVKDALTAVAEDDSIDLADFDKLDRYDLDHDGDYDEPDGIIDYLIVIHSGVGQEEGGGSLGSDAVWSHSSSLGGLYEIPGTSYTDKDGNTRPYYANKYTMDPENGASGVFEHETGHELGLPDEYNTAVSGLEPISNWSLMSHGSWAGKVPGAEATGISPYGRQMLQNIYGGRWQNQTVINYEDLDSQGTKIKLNSSALSGDTVKINLPPKSTELTKPFSGEYAYYSGRGTIHSLYDTSMITEVDLSEAVNPKLNFKTWYEIEEGWDFASINVKEIDKEEWKSIPGNITTTVHDPNAEVSAENEITGSSNGWIDAEFDLSEYAGKMVQIQFRYQTDYAEYKSGIFADDITINDNGNVIFEDDCDSGNNFELDGFVKSNGSLLSNRYYLVEWRDHSGIDVGLGHTVAVQGKAMLSYDPGMLVWLVDEDYLDNKNNEHPGHGFISVVDADQNNILITSRKENTKGYLKNIFQMHDAAFSRHMSKPYYINFLPDNDQKVKDFDILPHRKFRDKDDYTNKEVPYFGVDLLKLDINMEIVKQALDDSNGTIKISRGEKANWWDSYDCFDDFDDMMDDMPETRWNHGTTPMWEF